MLCLLLCMLLHSNGTHSEDYLQVRRVVEDCIKNVHPIYHIKTLMIKRELAKDPNLATENWERFLPKFQKKNVERKKPVIVKKPEYTPFPPPQQPSKVDLQLESGEYFLSQSQKNARKAADQQEQQRQRVQQRQQDRLKAFVPPEVRLTALHCDFAESVECMSRLQVATSVAFLSWWAKPHNLPLFPCITCSYRGTVQLTMTKHSRTEFV